MLDAIQHEQAELIKTKDVRIAELTKQLEVAKTTIHDLKEKDEEIKLVILCLLLRFGI